MLQAGAGVKGEFENRLKGLIEEVKASPIPIILFIDEAHTMIGAGGQAGQNDAANLLKPALARGELRTIAATTWSEYKKYFEKDPALGSSLPSGEGRRADRDAVHGDDARHCGITGKASQGSHSRRGGCGGSAAFESLPCRTPTCRTKRSACWIRRARAFAGTKCDSRSDRRRGSPDSMIWRCRNAFLSRELRLESITASGSKRSSKAKDRSAKRAWRNCASDGTKNVIW